MIPNAPIALLLCCPSCGARHVDQGEFATKPHHTHACQACGMVWRPAIEPSVGVQFLPGFKDEAVKEDSYGGRRIWGEYVGNRLKEAGWQPAIPCRHEHTTVLSDGSQLCQLCLSVRESLMAKWTPPPTPTCKHNETVSVYMDGIHAVCLGCGAGKWGNTWYRAKWELLDNKAKR